ncbi:MAG TPA: preprotein translocase subunit YajC [Alphaproteobacteria bacterium]|jgi:preprotein translocase subunit YajC|nr:preprotein translocase subunit YajC [Alphaproteobacteria bacterium]
MLISPAYAQAAGGGGMGGDLVSFLPLILIFVVFWFFLIRPQQKRMKEHRELVSSLRRGDQVVTGGGLIGKVTKVIDDNTLQVELAENVRVRVVRSTITEVLGKTEPASSGEGGSGSSGGSGGAANQPERKSLLGGLLGRK